MYKRQCKPLKTNSFFLFGARGTGISTLVRELLPEADHLWIDLTDPDQEQLYVTQPGRLSQLIDSRPQRPDWVVIDEVQKSKKLLDLVHLEIEKRGIKFALTGSSARKLKRGGANLLAGRAFLNYLFPLTYAELKDHFDLLQALRWGTLPKVFEFQDDVSKSAFLKSYVEVYLKEEILQEQLVRNAISFRKFLPIAAQLSGTILNLNKVANDLGIDWNTARSYFEILEDTWLGFLLPAFSQSLRKQQLKSPKFYLFDLGVKRALDRSLSLVPETGQQIGPLFEHFIINEIFRLNHYLSKDFELSYLATEGGLEVDLIIRRPGDRNLIVEIKSTEQVLDRHTKHIRAIHRDFDEFEPIVICSELSERLIDKVRVMPWKKALDKIFQI
jgi:uncharacterized protein